MNDRQIQIFITVCEKMSMTEAAKQLFMTQSAVSQSIKETEQNYRVVLFERTGRKLVLTEAGKTLYEQFKQIKDILCDLDKYMEETEGVRQIYVGGNISAGASLLLDYVKTFEKTYPQIRVKIKVSGSKKLLDMLMKHELDFALMEDTAFGPELTHIPFLKDRTLAVVWPDHPLLQKKRVMFDDLLSENFLLREKGAGVRDHFDVLMQERNITIDPLWESSSTQILVKAVQQKVGISILPYQLIKESLAEGSIAELKIADLDLARNMNIVYRKNKNLNAPLRHFIGIINPA